MVTALWSVIPMMLCVLSLIVFQIFLPVLLRQQNPRMCWGINYLRCSAHWKITSEATKKQDSSLRYSQTNDTDRPWRENISFLLRTVVCCQGIIDICQTRITHWSKIHGPPHYLFVWNGKPSEFKIMLFFWVLAPCRLVGRCHRFGETYCIHFQGYTTQKPRRTSSSSPLWKPQFSHRI
jgi:hypothetical protein